MDGNGHRLSRQVFSIPLGEDNYLVYAPLKRIAFVANGSMVNAIADCCEDGGKLSAPAGTEVARHEAGVATGADYLEFLRQLGFFQAEPLPVDVYAASGICYDAAVLFLTNQCNLRCLYCYASSGDYPVRDMQWEVARAAIDFVAGAVVERGAPVMTLGFHGGGEPTLNWEVLTQSIAYGRSLADKHGFRLEVAGSFNGCWSDNVLRFMVNHLTELSLSFDGLPAVQDRQRPTATGLGSAAQVIRTLEALRAARLPYGIRMTVTERSLDSLEESVAFICERFRPVRIQVEPVFSEGRAKLNEVAAPAPAAFVQRFLSARREAANHGIELFYSGVRLDALTSRFCLAACRALVVTPEGHVTTCFEIFSRYHPLSDRFVVGHYQGRGQFSIDSERVHRHLIHTVNEVPWCEACYCKWHCAGDCQAKTGSHAGGADRGESLRCLVTRELTLHLLLDKIRESGGGVWIGPNQGVRTTRSREC